MDNIKISIADKEDSQSILKMYQSVIGTSGCTWNYSYPGELEIQNDIRAGSLYTVLLNGKIIGAASIVPKNELDNLSLWKIKNGKQRELARVIIRPEYQGNGYAKILLYYIINYLKDKKCSAIHLLASKTNAPAISLYEKLNFKCVGECDIYNNNFYAMEKILSI